MGGDHLSMVLRNIRNQAHRINIKDPSAIYEDLAHQLDSIPCKFEFEILIAPQGMLETMKEFEIKMKGINDRIITFNSVGSTSASV